MKTFYAFSAAVVLAMPMAAMAGGVSPVAVEPVVVPAVAVDVTPDWTGFYAGGALGYGNLTSNVGDYTDGFDYLAGSGSMAGILVGYRHDFGQFVLGGELDYNWTNIDIGENASVGTLDSLSHVKLQAGADIGKAFIYGTAGWAWGDVSFSGGGTDAIDGAVFGIGTDYAVNDKWTVGGEVLWNSFDDVDETPDAPINLDLTTFSLRAAYRF